MTAQLSCHVQNSVTIRWLETELKQNAMTADLNCEQKIEGEMDLYGWSGSDKDNIIHSRTMG